MDRREFIKGSGVAAAAAVGGGACASVTGNADKLAYFGGTPVMAKAEAQKISGPMFKWPIVNEAMRKASDDVLTNCKMSGTDIAKEFEIINIGVDAIIEETEPLTPLGCGYIFAVKEKLSAFP